MKKKLLQKLARVKLLLTDCDGVLTDSGVYYSERGEELKRFSIRDGMGCERLKEIASVEVGIITGENSFLVERRAEKLKITEIYLGVKNKTQVLEEIIRKKKITAEEIAFIGDDVNDLGVIQMVGVSACPLDAMSEVKRHVDYVCKLKGGRGAFREFCEKIIQSKGEKIYE